MKKPWNENAALRGAWRRIFARSPIVIEVLNEGKRRVPKYNKDGSRSKVDAVEFHCQVCNSWVRASVGGKKNIAVDHIVPVIAVENTTGHVGDWNEYKRRLFCDKKNLQRVCRACHQKKTNEERMARNTLKYNEELDDLQLKWVNKDFDFGTYKKLLSKYKTKTRPQAIRDRVQIIIYNLTKKAKKRKL
jgi:5-methylcytosine-specific restriction endonuclease McrA